MVNMPSLMVTGGLLCWISCDPTTSAAGDLLEPGQAAEEIARHAAVDDEVVAVDVARVPAEQEGDDVGHVLWRGDTAQRHERVALGGHALVGIHLGGHAGA